MSASGAGQMPLCRVRPRSALRRCALSGALTLGICLSAPVQADSVAGDNAPGWWQRAQDNMAATWLSDQYQLYVPVHTWHNRADYSVQKIASYNETPWGLGGGTYLFDSEGDWHAWYAMGFLDSHDQFEPIAGYGYQKIWRPATDWRLGAGFTLGFTARADYHDYPIPVVLPLLSVSYGRIGLETTYVPGGKGYGNILFTWLCWNF